ncbi:hypothetical protein MG293_000871 [Ovis ammon polii]|uniref:Lipase domain-containing protein n=1 Tax=Ovis ammon polii TaxID=230172 RepID=A0AAD4UM23_OVIAM|nr:hypothetical protein MG293_000871 [Ovis ammon polii]
MNCRARKAPLSMGILQQEYRTKQKPEQVYDNNVELDCPGLLAYGVSLGAHISGFVGKIFHGRVGRITGLDPAGPQFSGKPSHGRLDYTDANFVDVIHTDINGLEFIKCDHQRAVYLFMAALETNCNFISFSCRSYKDYKTGLCADCADFKEKSCPKLGYQTELWKDILKERIENTTLRTTVFLDTVGTNPFCTYYFVLSIIVLDKNMKDGYVTFKLLNQLGIVEEPRLYDLKVNVKLLSRVQLFATPWTVTYQALLSMGFSRQEYWGEAHSAINVHLAPTCSNLGFLQNRKPSQPTVVSQALQDQSRDFISASTLTLWSFPTMFLGCPIYFQSSSLPLYHFLPYNYLNNLAIPEIASAAPEFVNDVTSGNPLKDARGFKVKFKD